MDDRTRRTLDDCGKSFILAIAMVVAACSSTPQGEPTNRANATAVPANQPSSGVLATSGVSGVPAAAIEQPPAPTIPAVAQQKFDAAMKLVSAGKQDEAALQLEQLANDYPSLAAPLINAGLLYLKANQFDAAVRAFQRALERDANSALANNYLGVSYRNLGKFKEAEAAYLAAIAVDDSYAAAHLNLGVLYDLYLQKPEQALSEYERYQQLLSTPDTKVASWIKELKSRLSGNKPKAPSADAAAGDKS